MWILAGLIGSILLAALIYLAGQKGRLRVDRSLEIDATVEAVFDTVLDLKSWPLWSPWLMHEPDARIDYSDKVNVEGGYFLWDGKVIGGVEREINTTNHNIRQAQQKLDQGEKWRRRVGDIQSSVVGNDLSEEERRKLLRELQKYERERGELQAKIRTNEIEWAKLETQLRNLRANMPY